MTNSASDTTACSFVMRLNNVVLPALVYPTSATVGTDRFWRRSRSCERRCRTWSISRWIAWMRTRIRRRSVSSFVSPGPRVPMPPPSRDNAVPLPARRGSRYFNCASSTCHLPSRVRARRAKMSRINWVRSMTLRSSLFSSWRSWAGVSSLSKITTIDVRFRAGGGKACDLPGADERCRVRPGTFLKHSERDGCARSQRQASQLVERLIGVDTTLGARDETDECRTLCYR